MNGTRPRYEDFTGYLAAWVQQGLLGYLWILFISSACFAGDASEVSTETAFVRLLTSIHAPAAVEGAVSITETIEVTDCEDYPYHINDQYSGVERLVADLKSGLRQGLQCLTGQGPMGKLHAFHSNQASRLVELLESKQKKSLQCVSDELFAFAVAASPRQQFSNRALVERMKNGLGLSILLDTYRMGGLLSQKFDAEIYHAFFNLNQSQIAEHLTGKPLKMQGLHRYQNLPGLLFHEMVHWLGHEHTGLYPDLTFLYETCCFGGSDFIQDGELNAGFQLRACNILKDEELWSANRYQQMRLWQRKGYDQLKREMRDYYD